MTLKQISVTIPTNLFDASKEYSVEYGYRNTQELILELLRERVLAERISRYKQIEADMDKKGKRFSQKDAKAYLESL